VTRLTILKGLCQDPDVANRFVTYLVRKTLERVERGQKRAERLPSETARAHREMMTEALDAMADWIEAPTEARRQRLFDLRARMREEQNEYKQIKSGPVRLIRDADLLLFEYALGCLLGPPSQAGSEAYQTARHYAERYGSRYGTGLTPASAPLVQDIADFWIQETGLDSESLSAPARPRKEKRSSTRSGKGSAGKRKKVRFTPRQGQFLAFIHRYRQLHRRGPAELDLVKFFRVTPPAVHDMIVRLEELGLITREPGVARSARVVIPEEEIPELEETEGSPW
jgi:hypothetical protein